LTLPVSLSLRPLFQSYFCHSGRASRLIALSSLRPPSSLYAISDWLVPFRLLLLSPPSSSFHLADCCLSFATSYHAVVILRLRHIHGNNQFPTLLPFSSVIWKVTGTNPTANETILPSTAALRGSATCSNQPTTCRFLIPSIQHSTPTTPSPSSDYTSSSSSANCAASTYLLRAVLVVFLFCLSVPYGNTRRFPPWLLQRLP
jgi:hypothetical protein